MGKLVNIKGYQLSYKKNYNNWNYSNDVAKFELSEGTRLGSTKRTYNVIEKRYILRKKYSKNTIMTNKKSSVFRMSRTSTKMLRSKPFHCLNTWNAQSDRNKGLILSYKYNFKNDLSLKYLSNLLNGKKLSFLLLKYSNEIANSDSIHYKLSTDVNKYIINKYLLSVRKMYTILLSRLLCLCNLHIFIYNSMQLNNYQYYRKVYNQNSYRLLTMFLNHFTYYLKMQKMNLVFISHSMYTKYLILNPSTLLMQNQTRSDAFAETVHWPVQRRYSEIKDNIYRRIKSHSIDHYIKNVVFSDNINSKFICKLIHKKLEGAKRIKLNSIGRTISRLYYYYSNIDNSIIGLKVQISGRPSGSRKKIIKTIQFGSTKIQSINFDVSYDKMQFYNKYGTSGVKVWLIRSRENKVVNVGRLENSMFSSILKFISR